jgi:hypothetical protein
MSDFDRRQFLKSVLGKLALASGTVVLASAAAPAAESEDVNPEGADAPPGDIQKRADQLAAAAGIDEDAVAFEFLNRAFRNTPLGGFRNTPLGGFRNTPLGGFRNTPLGGFRNTPLGSFGNSGWPNHGFNGFRNGGWPNMGWPNGGWLNW